jgi:aryl-alcohol dehydrogenase-like predicted oxidoreductase
MRYRTLGRTGLQVSELGYGAWGIGQKLWVGAEDEESLRALHRAVELGVTFIDTALGYGDGHSERLVGQVVREVSETVYVATKVPPQNSEWPARPGVPVEQVFPGTWIERCAERSLEHLGLDTIDVLQLHVWSDEWVGQGDWLETIGRLRAEGKIRFFGVSINDHEPSNVLRLIESGAVDSVQVIYNVFDQSPDDQLFPAVLREDVGIVVRVPFDEGSLTGNVRPGTEFPPGDFRNQYFAGDRRQEVWDRVQAITSELDVPVERMAEIALRFCLSAPAVSTVIAGMRSARNVERNAAAVEAGPLSDDELAVLRRHRWQRRFYA